MAESRIDDELWDEFHRAVNMTSRELETWLVTAESGEVTEALPDQAGSDRSRAVLDVLSKRRTDLSDSDVEVMRSVVEEVQRERGDDRSPTAGDTEWRHRLMSIGHDPLKPTG